MLPRAFTCTHSDRLMVSATLRSGIELLAHWSK